MSLKKMEFILVLAILFGIHLSLQSNVYVRASYLLMALYILILLIKGKIPFTTKSMLAYISISVIGLIPYLLHDTSNITRSLNYLYYILQGFIVVFVIVKNKDIDWVKSIIFVYWIFNISIGIYEIVTENHLVHANIYNYTQTITNVPLGLFFNQNDYGIFLSLVTPYFFIKYFNSKRQRIYYLMALSLNIFLIISTGSIGAYLTLAINLLIAFILIENKDKWKILYFPALIFAVYNAFQNINIFEKIEIDYILRKIARHSTSLDLIPTDRVNIISSYLNIFKDNLLGVGAGQATIVGKANYGISINPHSLLVEVAVEYGLIGLMIILTLYFVYLYRLIRVMAIKHGSLDHDIVKKSVFINYITMILWTNVPSRVLNGFDIFWIFIGLIILILYNSTNLNEV